MSLQRAKLGQSLKSIIRISPEDDITQSPPYIGTFKQEAA